MYWQHFGLRVGLHRPDADPRRFHPVRAHEAGLQRIVDAVRPSRSVVAMRAPTGAGKTMLLRVLAAELRERVHVVVVDASARRIGGLYDALARALGVDLGRDRDAATHVHRYLAVRAERGEHTLLAIDDADTLPDNWLAELARLIDTDGIELPIILAAEDSPGASSQLPVARALHQRVDTWINLEPLEASECPGFLMALTMAAGGGVARLFTDEAAALLHELAEGLPGRVSEIADRAMLVAYGRGADRVEESAVLAGAEQVAAGRGQRTRAREAGTVLEAPIVIHRRQVAVEEEEEAVQQPRAMAVGGGFGVETPGRAAGVQVASGAPGSVRLGPGSSGPTTGPRPIEEPSPWLIDDERQREIMAGIRRPDRPAWDRAKFDPFRSPMREEPPFGPEMLAVISDPHGHVAEWFRVLRLRIEEWMESLQERCPVMLVTSSEAGAGKTFVATNLALLFANEPGLRVLLVDGDMRRPRFEGLFGVPSRPGRADVLAGRTDLEAAVHFVSEVGLYVLAAGRPGNPRDLVSPDRTAPTVRQMREQADLVIIDGPPMDPYVDARSLAAVADGALFVVRSGQTRAPDLGRSIRSLDRNNLIGAVVTDLDDRSAERSNGEFRRPRP